MLDFAASVLAAPLGKAHLFSVGQAGYIIKSESGELLGIDLYLSDCVERAEGHVGFKRMLPKLLEPGELRFDCLIATHPHLDHFDMDSMPRLMAADGTRLFASVNCREIVRRLRMSEENVRYVKPGECHQCGDFGLRFVPCDHGDGAPDAVGVIVSVGGKRIFEVGDSCLRLDWVDALRREGPFDALIAPINGAYGNLNEAECAELANALQPKLTIPCHYGMFASHGGNPGRFIEIMNRDYPGRRYAILRMGEGVALDEL